MEQYKIGICAIGFNRVDSLKRLLNSLEKAIYDQQVTLIVSIDRSNDTSVKEMADDFTWSHGEKNIIFQDHNLGLRKHVLKCGSYMNLYNLDALVVLEDDITVSPYYLQYVKSCLSKYKDDDRIAGFSLYNFSISYVTRLPFHPVKSEYDIYMMNCAMSWGQVWTPRKWHSFMEWYKTMDDNFDDLLPDCLRLWSSKSWLKYHTRYCIETNKYFIYPYMSLSTNNNEVGTHAIKSDTSLQGFFQCLPITEWRMPTVEDCEVKYDGFFEPKFLGSHLRVAAEELTIDLYGGKKRHARYLLTRKSLPYKIVSSFALKHKPIEANILFKIDGDGIYLYDTTISGTAPIKQSTENYFVYNYINAMEHISNLTGLKMWVISIKNKQVTRFRFYKKKIIK